MTITIAFQQDEQGFIVISAYDDYTEDTWNGVPDFHKEALKAAEGNGPIREARIRIAERDVERLFSTPELNWEIDPGS